jgi:dTDP-4-amino-4,6-dideoxygalactose transaminase
MKKRIDQLKNFGFVDEVTVVDSGMNGKMSEINAAFGLLQLKHMPEVGLRRTAIANFYNQHLANIPGITVAQDNYSPESNHSYYPILVGSEFALSRDALYERLKENGIFSRRYFYPLISDFPMYKHLPSSDSENLPVATEVAKKILCLPIYPALSSDDLSRVVKLIRCAS